MSRRTDETGQVDKTGQIFAVEAVNTESDDGRCSPISDEDLLASGLAAPKGILKKVSESKSAEPKPAELSSQPEKKVTISAGQDEVTEFGKTEPLSKMALMATVRQQVSAITIDTSVETVEAIRTQARGVMVTAGASEEEEAEAEKFVADVFLEKAKAIVVSMVSVITADTSVETVKAIRTQALGVMVTAGASKEVKKFVEMDFRRETKNQKVRDDFGGLYTSKSLIVSTPDQGSKKGKQFIFSMLSDKEEKGIQAALDSYPYEFRANMAEARTTLQLLQAAFKDCRKDFTVCGRPDDIKKLLHAKTAELRQKKSYEKASAPDSTKTIAERHLAFLDYQKARIQYRTTLYGIRGNKDEVAKKKKDRASVLLAHVEAMRSACDPAVSLEGLASAKLSDFPHSSTDKNGLLGKIRKDLLKEIFKKDRMHDLKYCTTVDHTKTLFAALLAVREAEHRLHLSKTPETQLAKIKSDLLYRKAFYEMRCEVKDKKGVSKDKKAVVKLAATKEMLQFVTSAETAVREKLPAIGCVLTTTSDAKQGKLGKLREALKQFRDTHQEACLAEKQTAFAHAKSAYRAVPVASFNERLIAKLAMLQAELALKIALYEGRASTSKTHYHGFFSKRSMGDGSVASKLTAARELKKSVDSVLAELNPQEKKVETALSISEALSKTVDTQAKHKPGQDTLNRIRDEVSKEVVKLVFASVVTSSQSGAS